MRIAIIGATGVVGREIVTELTALDQSGDSPFETPTLFATAKTAGESIQWTDGDDLIVEQYDADALRGTDLAIIATPASAAPAIATRARQLGATVIDLSRAHRSEAPMFLDGMLVPAAALASTTLISLPSADTLQLARVVKPLRELGVRIARATIMRAASGAGQVGINELAESTGRLLNGQEPETPQLGHRLAFNAIPQVGPFSGPDTEAEADLRQESRHCLEGVTVSATTLWSPWFYGHVQVLSLSTANTVTVEQVRDRLRQATHVKVLDQPAESIFPMPMLATGDDAVLVGRIRIESAATEIVLLSAMDNARGSAAHAIEAALAVARARHAH